MNRLKNVRLNDILSIPVFIIAIIPSLLLKLYLVLKNKDFWLIAEENEASDNGYVFYKYMITEHPEQEVYYALNSKSKDYTSFIKECGTDRLIAYGSLKHWIYYLAARANISSQKGGKPNAAICYILEVYGFLKNFRVFLQHGVILNNTEFLHYKNTKISLFIAGAKPEYEYIQKEFGYPKKSVAYCGLCRFDNLHDVHKDPNAILLMPTWRSWLKLKGKARAFSSDEIDDVLNSEYIQTYQKLLDNPALIKLLEENKKTLYFYPHRNAQSFIEHFNINSDRIVICDDKKYKVQDLLKQCSLLITDYSSVSIDVAYMKKPIIYFQFDEDKFRTMQYEESYFNYRESKFGYWTKDIQGVVDGLSYYLVRDCSITEETYRSHGLFFELFDRKNCERNYKAICKILN
ncbi:CDP-glycerol glycerophosphotransferase family protein [Streptococcus suis]